MPTFTPEEYATATDHERLLADMLDALEVGDVQLSSKIMRKIDFSADTLMRAKHIFGADWIKEQGLKTHTAEAKYGKDWFSH